MYDGDNAGQNAAVRSSEVISEVGGYPRVAVLPEGLDPDEFLRKYGADSFTRIVEQGTISSTAFKLDMARQSSQLSSRDGVVSFVTEALKIIAEVKSPVERETYLRELAGEFDLSLETLVKEMQLLKAEEKTGDKAAGKWNTNINNGRRMFQTVRRTLPPHIKAEKKLLSYMLIDPGVATQVQNTILDEFSVEEYAALAVFLYRYYASNEEANPAQFISQLPDQKLVQIASELALEVDAMDFKPELAEECILKIQRYREEQRLQMLPKEMEDAAKHGDFEKLRLLTQEQLRLRQKLR
jgi:DNA primase